MFRSILTTLLLATLCCNSTQAENRTGYLPEQIETSSFRCKYSYDQSNRKIKEEVSLINNENLYEAYTLLYTYNNDGTIKTTCYKDYLVKNNQKQDSVRYSYTDYYKYRTLSDTLIVADVNHKLVPSDQTETSDSAQFTSTYYSNPKGFIYKETNESEGEKAVQEYSYNSDQQIDSYTKQLESENIMHYEQKYKKQSTDKKNGIFKNVKINTRQPNYQVAQYFMLFASENPTKLSVTTKTQLPYEPTGNEDIDYETISKSLGLYYIYNDEGYPCEVNIYELDNKGNKDIRRDKFIITYTKAK